MKLMKHAKQNGKIKNFDKIVELIDEFPEIKDKITGLFSNSRKRHTNPVTQGM